MAIDCEMVVTKDGFELARLTIMNEHREVICDELVKPTNPIVDYNTRYSGIDEARMKNVTFTLKDAQKRFCELVSA
jgi:RNA exonuclease 1